MKIQFIIIVLVLSVYSVVVSGQNIKGYVLDGKENPLIGAHIYWEESKKGTVTDESGFFELEKPLSEHMLHVEYTGYNSTVIHISGTEKQQKIILKENTELDEVVIIKSVPGKIKNRVDVIQTEKITLRELSRAACCNLSESFETNPSVDVTYSDAVTGAKQIQLLGLAGTYVQMLTENYPNMRGTASIYGMDYIPGPWMESIQVSKGAASVKNGYESVTGQINIEYKKPKIADPLSLNFFASDAGRFEANTDGAIELNDKLSSGLFLHFSNEDKAHDKNNDGFFDMPKKHQFNIMNRWHYQTDNFISQSGIKFVNDERRSGQTTHSVNEIHNPYRIYLKTNCVELFTKNGLILNQENNESIALILSGTYHDQKSDYAESSYNVYQTNIYGSLLYERDFGEKHKLSMGLSINADKYDQSYGIDRLNANGMDDRETVSGGYAQYTFSPHENFTVLAGIRADYSSLYNWFITPRLHIKYNMKPWWQMRASAGKGYRTAFILAENSYLLASSRKINIADNLNQESAWNYGLSSTFYIPVNNEELIITGEWYYTDFQRQVVMDMDSDPHTVSFYNLNGKSYSHNFQIEASYPLFRGFTLLGAYRWIEPKTNYNGKILRKPLTSRYKALATASYETRLRKWQFDLTAQFNGGGRMPAPDEVNPLWATGFKSYTVINAQVTKFFRTWSVYIGGENLNNFRQKETVVSAENPYSSDFDATMVWGPTIGRKFYIGFQYNISKL